MRGIAAADVQGRIGLGITLALRLCSTSAKGRPVASIWVRMKLQVPLRMPRTADMSYAIRPSRSALTIGMPPQIAASNFSPTPFRSASCGERGAMARQQRLVRRHHMLSAAESALHQRAGDSFLATDQFNHQIDIIPLGERKRVGFERHAGQICAAVSAPVTGRNGGDPDAPSGAPGQSARVILQYLCDTAADRSKTGEADADDVAHLAASIIRLLRPKSRNRRTLRAAWRIRCSFSTSATRT